MTHLNPSRRVLRGVGAVLAGLVAVVVLSHGTDALLHGTGVFPPTGQPVGDGLFLLALVYRSVFGIAGGALTGRLAPRAPLRHALALGGIGTVAGLAGALATWNAGPEFGPKWYALAVAASALPCAWLGARLSGERA